jgi:hypothetical protein
MIEVQSPKFRLKNGIGVGDSIFDVFNMLGQSAISKTEDNHTYMYQATWPNGDISSVILIVYLEGRSISSFFVIDQ